MTARIVRSGGGWRIGWNPAATEFPGLIGTDDWAIELTAVEFADFVRLTGQLVATMRSMQAELMDEEAIDLEAESAALWLEVTGFPSAYTLRVIIQSGRRAEGTWAAAAVAGLVEALPEFVD
jgi:Domain of unknown function (DUF1818)